MTEKQIETLKQVLESSNAQGNSADLDNKILTAANAQAEVLRQPKSLSQPKALSQQRQSQPHGLRFNFLGSTALGAGLVSIVLTAGVFLGLSQILKSDAKPAAVVASSSPVELRFDSALVNSTHGNPHGVNPELGASVAATSESMLREERILDGTVLENARDQVLASMTLPDVTDVLGNTEFSFDAEREFAQQSVQLAINDIRSMIGQGRLDKARQRYEQLRQLCDVCVLPSTLEALVMNADASAGSG